MKIISISGLDGSGKSTQVELLKKYLESQNKKVVYFHAVQFSLPQATKTFFKKHCLICKLLGRCKVDTKPKQAKGVTKANWLQIQLRKFALRIDLIRFKSYLKKLEKQDYDYLVSDRYFYDNIININYLSLTCHPKLVSGSRNRKSGALKFGIPDPAKGRARQVRNDRNFKRVPRPDNAFYLKTDPQQIMLRDRVPEQGLEYLETKKELFDKFTPVFKLKIIDGNQSKEAIFEEIKKEIGH